MSWVALLKTLGFSFGCMGGRVLEVGSTGGEWGKDSSLVLVINSFNTCDILPAGGQCKSGS